MARQPRRCSRRARRRRRRRRRRWRWRRWRDGGAELPIWAGDAPRRGLRGGAGGAPHLRLSRPKRPKEPPAQRRWRRQRHRRRHLRCAGAHAGPPHWRQGDGPGAVPEAAWAGDRGREGDDAMAPRVRGQARPAPHARRRAHADPRASGARRHSLGCVRGRDARARVCDGRAASARARVPGSTEADGGGEGGGGEGATRGLFGL